VNIIMHEFSKMPKSELLSFRRVGTRCSARENQRDVVATPCALARAHHILFVLTNVRLSRSCTIRHAPKAD
jgi:hypothetical protein